VLPLGGGRGRQGYPRHDPPAPVPERWSWCRSRIPITRTKSTSA
jgi:hypothetical protein